MPGADPLSVLHVLVLGPITVKASDTTIQVERLLERAMVARLALASGAPVTDERLAADLWGPADLARPTERLRVLTSRLRATLVSRAGGTATPLRRSGGYALDAQAVDLVAARTAAERMHAAKRSGDHAGAAAAAKEALALFRGPALGDLRAIPYAALEGERLDSWRLDLLVERLSADLALGAAAEVTDELERLAVEHPLHERVCTLLALALYRSGRQADGLDRLGRLRRTLAEDLGVDPAPETAQMELRLLRQDPALLLSAPIEVAEPAETALEVVSLPAPSTSFVGREGDVAATVARLAKPGLVTLTGGPGSGKSRLAVEVARAVAATGRAVTLVELASLHRDGGVPATVAAAVGVDSGEDPVQEVAARLEGALLVLDNAEHLVEQVAEFVAAVRRRAGALSVLVTSQRPLLAAGEELLRVGPLGREAAARLFAHRGAPDQEGADAHDVDAVCAAVDRLPLGIELAAGLTRTLTVRQLAGRVNDRLRLLVGGGRDRGGRHTSLRAALDWSHDLLDVRERAVLRRLAIFSGGFTLEAAEQVVPDAACAGRAGEEVVERGDLAPTLAELADRSLITVEAGAGRRRFRLLETVRDYAMARLEAASETEALRGAHLRWCREFVLEAAEPDDFATAEAVVEVFAEWPNLREALDLAPGTERAADGLRLALALHTPWLIRGWYGEARRHFAALTDAQGSSPLERLAALSDHGFVSTMVGRFDEAAGLLTQAAELAEQVGDDVATMTVLYYRGIVDIERGMLREAFSPLLDGLKLARRLNHAQRQSAFADALGTLHLYCGNPRSALELYVSALAHDRQAGDEHGLARGLSNQGQALIAMGLAGEAVALALESDHYATRLDDRQILPLNEVVRGSAALLGGDLEAAEKHLRKAVAYAVTDGSGITMAHIDLADVLILRGALAEAATILDAVYEDATERSTPWLAARAVSAALALAGGDLAEADSLAKAVAADYAASGFAWPRYTTRLAAVQSATRG